MTQKKIYTLSLDPDVPIGGVFHFGTQKQLYKVVKNTSGRCDDCAFWIHQSESARNNPAVFKKCCRFSCNGETRKDGFNVYAVKVKAKRETK